jgi:hypothetical protein
MPDDFCDPRKPDRDFHSVEAAYPKIIISGVRSSTFYINEKILANWDELQMELKIAAWQAIEG